MFSNSASIPQLAIMTLCIAIYSNPVNAISKGQEPDSVKQMDDSGYRNVPIEETLNYKSIFRNFVVT